MWAFLRLHLAGCETKFPALKALAPTQSEPPFLGSRSCSCWFLLSLGFSQPSASPRKRPTQSERCCWLGGLFVSSSAAGASIHPSHGSWNRKPLSWGKVSLSERTMNTSTKRKLWIGGGLCL